MGQKQLAGVLGAALLLGGVFMPIFGSPLKGTVTYLEFSRFEASVVAAAGGVGLLLSLARIYGLLWVAGLVGFGGIGFTFVKFLLITSGQGSRFAEFFFDSPFPGINRLVMETFSLEWGWGPLLAGAVLLLVGGRLQGTAPGGGR